MSELLVCKKQYNDGSVGFYSFNPKDVIVWNEEIEKNNLYAVAKVDSRYAVVKVIGLADCLVDELTLSGNIVGLVEIVEMKSIQDIMMWKGNSMEIIKVENGYVLDKQSLDQIKEVEKLAKSLKAKQDAIKAELLKVMEDNNIIKFENEDLLINYIAPTQRETFDSKQLKADNPDLYDLYVKLSPVKASVRIKLK